MSDAINWDEVYRLIDENKRLKEQVVSLEAENARLRKEISRWSQTFKKLGR